MVGEQRATAPGAVNPECWVCGGSSLDPWRSGPLPSASGGPSRPSDLRITDRAYGTSAPLVQCRECDFVQAAALPDPDLVGMYEDLEDAEYVEGREYRLRQMEALLTLALARAPDPDRPPRRLLDVGASTGLLVEVAQRRGLDAVGIEPSRALAADARSRGLDVHQGTLPHPACSERSFDVVTCVDVIEHVTDPVGLLRLMAERVGPGGYLIVTTPDIESLVARLLGRRWWHYRSAHVCFFPHRAMVEAMRRAGLAPMGRARQTWWFSVPYLAARAGRLLGGERAAEWVERRMAASRLGRFIVPLNAFDSWIWFARAAPR